MRFEKRICERRQCKCPSKILGMRDQVSVLAHLQLRLESRLEADNMLTSSN